MIIEFLTGLPIKPSLKYFYTDFAWFHLEGSAHVSIDVLSSIFPRMIGNIAPMVLLSLPAL